MFEDWIPIGYLISAIFFIFGLKKLGHPRTAPRGNQYGMMGMAIAVITTVLGPGFKDDGVRMLFPAIIIGAIIAFSLLVAMGD